MLHLIGIGLNDEKDTSLKALEMIKSCDFVYLESYTSRLQCDIKALEKLYNKKIILADRDLVENNTSDILKKAKEHDVAFLVIGDVFSATTHTSLLLEAKKQGIGTDIIHNASVLTAVGETGLEMYKFGRVASIPFENKDIKAPVEVFNNNYKNDLHTLFLFDLDPGNKRYMDFSHAADYLIRNNVNKDTKAVACAALGSKEPFIKYCPLSSMKDIRIKKFPQCLIIPAKRLHFIEEEALELWK